MRSAVFEAYIDPARLYPEIWRLCLGIGVIVLFYAGIFSLMLVAAYPVLGPLNYFGWLMGLSAPNTPAQTLFVLATFLGMGVGVLIAAPALHYREPGSLFGPLRETTRGFFTALLAIVPVYAVLVAVGWLLSPPEANMEIGQWLRLLPVALLLVLIQTSSEELLFRGYLQQQLAARFAARVIWMGLPALIFAGLHYNRLAGPNAWFIMAVALAYALAAADLTERSGSLGMAMGWHFANNCSSILLVSLKGTITGLALYVTPYDMADMTTAPLAVGLDILVVLVIWRLLRALI
ncbi:MAG: CPBP family intramembrane metalloprotease [Rhodobacteraceae bacterium]|nr:CPBP family intramembrane metalloprotease [Paracoccaceae bacterium]